MSTIATEPVVVMPVKRKDGTHALRLCLNQGELTPGQMQSVMNVMVKYELTALRATTGQRMNLEGIPDDKVDDVIAELGTSIKKCPPGVGVCPGGGICRYGVQPTRDLGDRLLALVMEKGPYPFKVKSGVSGCRMACGLSYVRDVGLVATKKGWTALFGAHAGRHARLGVELGTEMTEDQALEAIAKALDYYKENGVKRERTGVMVKRLGLEKVTADLLG